MAATRAREVLVLPRLGSDPPTKSWKAVVDLGLETLPEIEITKLPPGKVLSSEEPENGQTRERFAAEASRIHDQERRLGWTTPSLDEEGAPPLIVDGPAVLSGDDDGSMLSTVGPLIQSGPDRGLVFMLLEEVLSRETAGDVLSLMERAEALIRDVGREPTPDPSAGLSPSEIAGCVARALALPEVVSLRSRLVHEFPSTASR